MYYDAPQVVYARARMRLANEVLNGNQHHAQHMRALACVGKMFAAAAERD